MRVGPTGVASHPAPGREVEPRRTPVSRGELRDALARAHAKVTGHAPSPATLDLLTAQASLETASGAKMYNFNFGGIKGHGPSGETARLRTHEILGGKDVELRDGFRAYRSIDDGATDYVRLMRDRFPGAMAEASRGDVAGFAHALKQSSYYTADEKAYASGLRSLIGPSAAHANELATMPSALPHLPNTSSVLGGASPAEGFADGTQLSRVMDAIGHHRPAPDDDDET